MRRMLWAVSVVLIVLASTAAFGEDFSNPWVRKLPMGFWDRLRVEQMVRSSQGSIGGAMGRMALLKEAIDQICFQHGIYDPFPIYGLILTESNADPMAIDHVWRNAKTNKVKRHSGLGQGSSGMFDVDPAVRDEIEKIANQWRTAHREQWESENALLWQLVKIDPAFHALDNLLATIIYFKHNLELCGGSYTLAIMAHHGGTYSPIRQMACCLFGSIGETNEKKAIAYMKLYGKCKKHEKDALSNMSQFVFGKVVPEDKVRKYMAKHQPNYFFLRAWELKYKRYWSKKADGHLNYAYVPMAKSEVFWKFWTDQLKVEGRYPFEVSLRVVLCFEHYLYYPGKPTYSDSTDLSRAAERGWILPEPSWLKNSCFYLADDIGERDPEKANQELYRCAPPQVWGALREISARTGLTKPVFRIDSLVRTVQYSRWLNQGALNTSHNYGGAFDIDLDSLTIDQRTLLHMVLYKAQADGLVAYYPESNGKNNGSKLSVGSVPYDFRCGGQVHVIVNSFKKKYFCGVFAGSESEMICRNGQDFKEDHQVHLLNFVISFLCQFAGEARHFWASFVPFVRDLAIIIFVLVAVVKLTIQIFWTYVVEKKLFVPWFLETGRFKLWIGIKAFFGVFRPKQAKRRVRRSESPA